ncbi:metallopeptidase [Nocardia thailandica]
MRYPRLGLLVAAVLIGVSAVTTGCATTVASDKAVASAENPWEVAGAASSSVPSGRRPNVPDAPLSAENGDNGSMDKLALNAIADIEEFWNAEYAKTFPGSFTKAAKYISWDAKAAKDKAVQFCRSSTYHLVNAAYCGGDHTIGWDRGVLLPELVGKFGELSVVMVLAHEYGHAVQGQAKIAGLLTSGLVKEQQADCLAGVFLRHVAEGRSKHFTLNTEDGLNGVLGATVAVRDRDPDNPKNVHGSAFERVTAVQMGYTDGAGSCKTITKNEIAKRRGNLPTTFEDGERDAQLSVDKGNLDTLARELAKIFPDTTAPKLDYTGLTKGCPKVTTTEPVSYCPATDTVGTDVAALVKRAGDPSDGEESLSAVVEGDYNAFVVFVSRYVLAVQQDRKLSLTGASTAGLRTACLTGVVTTKLSEEGRDPRLSAGDLDEAVSGLLADGKAAADVDGKVVAGGYQRLEAFRTGVLDGEQACLKAYA